MAVRPTLFTFDNNGLTSPDGGNVIINPTGTIDSAVSLAIDEISGGGGGTGGGSVKNVIGGEIISISDTPKNPIKAPVETIPGVSSYTIRIGANITGATIFINNEQIAKTTPTNLTISKVDLLKGSKTITIKKEGYFSSEKYVLSVLSKENTIIIDNPKFEKPLGIDNAYLDVKYFVNDIEGFYDERKNVTGNYYTFTYNLSKKVTEIITEPKLLKFNVVLSGPSSSVKINKNGLTEFYPIEGKNEYEDILDTVFNIETSKPSLYKISEISIVSDGNPPQNLIAERGESLSLKIELKTNYEVYIKTEEVPQGVSGLDPQISLLKSDSRTYNINSKLGVPIAFQKNVDVKSVTVVIGETVLEYNDLDEGDIAGITIPHSAFNSIGRYNVKIYPFSFKDYEQQVRPAQPPLQVKTKIAQLTQKPTTVIEEKIKIIPPKEIKTPYELPKLPTIPASPILPKNPIKTSVEIEPTISISSSGGGGTPTSELIFTDFNPRGNAETVVSRVSRLAIK